MNSILLCFLALASTFWAGRRSLGLGIAVLLAWGYTFGIVRANLMTQACYFIFDAALLGLYVSQKWFDRGDAKRAGVLRTWLAILVIWPILILVLPFQPLLVSLVGLRGSILFLPMLLLGSKMRSSDLRQLWIGLAVLNLVALGFAVAEYLLGVPRFYPYNAATLIIYSSVDVAGGFYRIPAIFSNAHSFGGTMVASIPFLIGGWDEAKGKSRILALAGIVAAFFGVLMSATRLNFIIGVALLGAAMWNRSMKGSRRMVFVLLVGVLSVVALRNERFQRFKSLSDTESVESRISGSVNRTFLEILLEYPMGNGLGGGGTSLPYFLEGQVRNPIGMENEYVRIMAEQGVIGLIAWAGFVLWFFSRLPIAFGGTSWVTSRKLVFSLSAFGLLAGLIGTGMLTAIPHTAMLLLGMGWTSLPMLNDPDKKRYFQQNAARLRQVPASVGSLAWNDNPRPGRVSGKTIMNPRGAEGAF